MSQLVYFSSSSENTQRFIERLGLPAVRIPLNERERIQVDEPYIQMINVDRVPEAAEALRAQGFRQLPVVIAGDLSWSGFRPDMINRLHPAPHAASA